MTERERLVNVGGRDNQMESWCGRTMDAVWKSQAFECDQVFVRGTWWISQGRPVTAYSGKYGLGVGIETLGDERVGMLCRESVGSQAVNRKVRRLRVTIRSALPSIAAASTWTSSGSGRSSPAARAV